MHIAGSVHLRIVDIEVGRLYQVSKLRESSSKHDVCLSIRLLHPSAGHCTPQLGKDSYAPQLGSYTPQLGNDQFLKMQTANIIIELVVSETLHQLVLA